MSALDQAPVRTKPDSRAEHAPRPASLSAGVKAPDAEVLQLLVWVARRPRTYAEAMEVWQTSCPRHSVWEDACGDELVQVETGSGTIMDQSPVALTLLGRAVLNGR